MSIEIINIRNNAGLIHPYDFFIDRRSQVGNPFILSDTNNKAKRDAVCDDYEEWFKNHMNAEMSYFKEYIYKMRDAYKKHGKLRLFCWCAPKRCHGETIKKYIEKDCHVDKS